MKKIIVGEELIYSEISNLIKDIVKRILSEKNHVVLGLPGGRSISRILDCLKKEEIDWNKVHIFMVDERLVPLNHEDSNYRMAQECLLEHVPVDSAQIYPMPTDCEQPSSCAAQYEGVLNEYFQKTGKSGFDLVLLGMGEDGHTASLFPGTDIIANKDDLVAAVYVDKFDSWRISLTYTSLEMAQQIYIIVCGDSKQDIVHDVLNNPDAGYPVQYFMNVAKTNWFLDDSAARKVL